MWRSWTISLAGTYIDENIQNTLDTAQHKLLREAKLFNTKLAEMLGKKCLILMLATLVMSEVARKDEKIVSNQVNTSLKSFNCFAFHSCWKVFSLCRRRRLNNPSSHIRDSREQLWSLWDFSERSLIWEVCCFRWFEYDKLRFIWT